MWPLLVGHGQVMFMDKLVMDVFGRSQLVKGSLIFIVQDGSKPQEVWVLKPHKVAQLENICMCVYIIYTPLVLFSCASLARASENDGCVPEQSQNSLNPAEGSLGLQSARFGAIFRVCPSHPVRVK